MKRNKAVALASVALAGTFVLSGCTAKATDTLINVGNGKDKITFGYGNFVAKYNQAVYDQYYLQYMGEGYWSQEQNGKTMEETVKENVIDGIEEQYVDKLHASDYDVELTSADKKKIKAAVKKFFSSNTDKAIDQMGATEEYVQDLLEYETYQARVRQKVEDQADVTVTDDEANQSTISYVYFSTASTTDASGNAVEKTDSEKAALKKQAENVAAASDFDAAAKKEGAKVETDSYTTKGDSSEDTVVGEDVINAAKKLTENGQISDVIEVKDKGYYVVRMDKLFDKSATAKKKESLTSEKKQDVYDKLVKKWKKSTGFDLNEKLWKQVTFDDLFTQKASASGDASSNATN